MIAQEETPDPATLGNPDEFNIKELTKTVNHLTATNSGIVYDPPPHDDP